MCPLDFIMNHWDFFKDVIIPLIAAFVGAIIGGRYALRAGREAHENNIELEKLQRRIRIDGVLIAISSELKVLREKYMRQAGGVLDDQKDGETFDLYYSLRQEYFIVYPKNTDVVGQIDDEELVNSIVRTYNTANFLLEMFWINNWYHSEKLPFEKNKQRLELLKTVRIAHAKILKGSHNDLLRETQTLLERIDIYRAKHPIQKLH